jgi:hypothetical protein
MYWPMSDSEVDASARDYYARLADNPYHAELNHMIRQVKRYRRRNRMARKKRRGWA